MSSFNDVRSGLLKKYNISAASKSGSTRKKTEFESIRERLLDKYSEDKTEKRKKAVSDWTDKYNSVIKGVSDYQKNLGGGYTKDASGGYAKAIDELIRDYDGIKDYANRLGLPNSQRYLKQLQQMQSGFRDTNAYMSQFLDEADYNHQVSRENRLDALKKYDVAGNEAVSKRLKDAIVEASGIREQLGIYQNDALTMLTQRDKVDALQKRLDDITREFGSLDEMKTRASAIQQDLGDAKRVQEGIRMAQSAKADRDFTALGAVNQANTDAKYRYINDENYRRQYDAMVRNNAVEGHKPVNNFAEAGLEQMSGEERRLYNYYWAKGGAEAAETYLDSIRDELNSRKARAIYEDLSGDEWLDTAMKFAFAGEAGVDQWQSGARGAMDMLAGKDSYVPSTAKQMASGMVREDLKDVGPKLPDWMGGGSLGQMGYDAISTTANMAPSILASTVANVIAPGSGQVVGNIMLGGSALGGAYREAINRGYSKEQAGMYASMIAASEVGLNGLLGGISQLGGVVSKGAVEAMLDQVDNAIWRVAGKTVGGMLSEGLEEGLQEIMTSWISNITLGTGEKVSWDQVLYSGLMGSLTAFAFEGTGAVSEAVNTNTMGMDLKESGVTGSQLADLGKTFDIGSKARELAERVNDSTDAYTMGRLFREIGAGLSEQNKADIAKSLMDKGMSQDLAVKHAEIMEYIIEGGEVSSLQMEMIQKNDVLAQTMQEVVQNAESTVGKRNAAFEAVQQAGVASDATVADGVTVSEPESVAEDNLQTEENEDYETIYGGREDGKTYLKSTGKAVEPGKVTAIKDGKVTLETQDGQNVDAEDVEFGDQGYDLVFRSITSAENMTPEAANAIMAAYEQMEGPTAPTFAWGAIHAYRQGYYGNTKAGMEKWPALSSNLTAEQRDIIYNEGRKAAQSMTAAAQARVIGTAKTGVEVPGKVHFDGNESSLTERQKTSIRALDRVASALGVQIHLFESPMNEQGKRVGANGWYDPKDGSIHIDVHAGANGEGTMLFTAAHELTHHIKQWSPEKFKKLSDFLMTEYGERNVNVDELVQTQQLKAARNKRHLTYDEAFEEVVADSMETMLADGRVIEKLERLKQQDRSLWQQVKDFISELAAKIRSVYEGLTPDSVEGRYVAEMKDSIEKLQEMFTEALVDASENYQANLTPGEESVVVNQEGDPVAYSTEDGSIMLSMRTYEENGRKVFRDYLQKCVSSKKLTKAEMQEMLDGIEDIYMICKEFKDKYAPFSSWSDAAVVRDTRGKPVFSVVTPNGDYKMNLDFSLVCKKRRTLDAVFNEMSRRGIIDDFELGQKSVVKINEIIRKYGMETACALCFVDAKRFRQASMADQFTSLYNELVESLVPEDQKRNIDHFNFAGYETIKKVEGGIDTWANSRLDFSHINHVLKTYGDGTVEYKAAKYIKSHAEGRKLLLRGDFMSSQGFDAVKTQNQDILKLYNSKKGTGGPKAAFGDVQYMNEVIQKARWWTPNKAYAVGGVRIQSFSDYVPRMVFDYVQMVYDLAATKLPAHAYSKEALFVKQFGLTGVKINMSLIPAIAEGGVAPGLDANGDYVWAGESFDFETAKEIQNAPGYTENCGTICVGVSDRHIRKLLSDPDIRMVIPYHKSGLNPIVAHMNKIAEFTDYTNKQNTTVKETGSKADKHFDFNEALHKMGKDADPRAVIQQYFDWCDDNGYDPKFAEFRDHPNYYKLIEDFTLYDRDGKYVPQREVRAVFPKETDAFGSMKDLIQEGLEEDAVIEGKRDKNLSAIVDEIQKTLPKTEAEIEETQVEQADRDLEAEVKYSFRGTNQDGIEVYETSEEVKKLHYKDRQQRFLDIMTNEYRGRTAKFIRNGHAYYATFEEKDVNKNIYGDKRSDKKGWKAKINVGAEGDIFELVENARYNGSLPEKGKKIAAHRGVGYWDYFIKNVQIDGAVFDLTANVRKKADGAFVYSIQLNENKKIKASPPRGSLLRALNGVPNASENRLAQQREEVKKYSDRDTGSVSNRSLLANALESVAQTPEERQKLQEYRERIDTVEDAQRRLDKLNGLIREKSFGKGPRDMEEIRQLQKNAAGLAETINKIDKKLLSLEASAPLKAVLEREKKKAYQRADQKRKEALQVYREKELEKQKQIVERYQESRAKGIESRKRTAMRHKIQNVVDELNNLLLNGDKKHHVPENLKKAVADALDLVNMDTVEAEKRAAKYANLIAHETDPDKIDAYTVKMENILRQGEKVGKRLQELHYAYEGIRKSDDPEIANAYDPVIAASLEELAASIGNTSLRNMTIEQLSDVYDMYRMVLTRVRDANKTFLNDKKESISNLASRVVGEIRSVGGEHIYRVAILDPVRSFLWNNMKPVYAFEYLGSSTLTDVFNGVRNGEDVWAKNVTEARAYYLDKSKKYNYDSWDFKKKYRFENDSGQKFELTLEQILSLYAYSKREQAHDHLRLGGFVFDSNIETYKEKDSKSGKSILKYKVNTADAHQITPEILADVISTLTPEQTGFVDEMQDYLSTTMGAKGNEVTMKMYGVKLFKEKFYFPLKSAKQFMFEQNEVSGEVRIKNSGFTNKTVAKANNPVILSNFMEVWSGHVNDMSMYHAFVLPLEDFNRVFNYNSPKKEGQPPVSVKGTIQSAYSPAAVSYVKNLITDLNGGARTDNTTGIINKMMGMFKKGAVFASASVVVQQPSAIARATALVDTKYFIGRSVDSKRHKELWTEIKQYAPVATIKEMGYFDTNMGKSTQDFLMGKEYASITERMKALFTDGDYRDELLSKGPALADELAWCSIWEAVQRETIDKNPGMLRRDREGFKKLVAERFTEVIVKTQVYDSVLSRSANMRSKDTGMKMATSFMAEPTTSINMISDALLQGKRGNKRYARKAIGSVLAAQLLNSILVSFVYAARDKDEDETYWEKYTGSVAAELMDSVNPLTYIPFIKDIVSIVQGYEIERSDMAVISDIWNGWKKLGSDTATTWEKVESFAGSIAQIFGLPVKNIMRDLRAVRQVIEGVERGHKTTRAGIGYALDEAIFGKSFSKQDKLYEAMLGNDPAQLARAKSAYDDEDAVEAAMRFAVRERYLSGEISAVEASRYLVKYCGMDASEARWKMDEWNYFIDNGSTEDYSKYNRFYAAVESGENLTAVIQDYVSNGVSEKTLSGRITAYFKDSYVEMSAAERAKLKPKLQKALTSCGVDQEDAEYRLDSWDFEAVYGFDYDDREEAYKDGRITAEQLKQAILTMTDKTEEEAALQVQIYDWEEEVPGCEITAAAIRDYNEHCAPANISKKIYYDLYVFEKTAGQEGVKYSKVKDCMPYIDSLDLTSEQKTALARAFWAESTVQKYKTW